MASAKILVVEDERLVRWSLHERLTIEGYEVEEAEDGATALRIVAEDGPDLAILDYRLPDTDGISVLRKAIEIRPGLMVVLMTAYSTVENAVEAMKLGAYDYVNKPFNMEEMVLTIKKALETTMLRREVDLLRSEQRSRFGLDAIIGKTPQMQAVFELIDRVGESPASTVLISGESGTGKDLVAKAIHYRSPRAQKPFVNITCTALPETLLESELFGHERGAFTDAKDQKKGLFEVADGGTIFLDEIGDMPLSLQAKILRVLDDRSFRRVGGSKDITVDVRIIGATNRDLDRLVDDGKFRRDLFYRLQVIPIHLPALRERRDDMPILAKYFIDAFNREFRKNVRGLSEEALAALEAYSWPGNVRELRNMIERAMILGRGEWIRPEDLFLRTSGQRSEPIDPRRFILTRIGVDIESLERDLVKQALTLTSGNQTRAARLLGLNRDQIRYRMEKFGFKSEAFVQQT